MYIVGDWEMNPCGQIGTEQPAICGLVGQPPNGAQPKVDSPRGQSSGFQVTAIPKHHNAIERQPWLRTVPVHELVYRVPIPALRFRAAQFRSGRRDSTREGPEEEWRADGKLADG